MIVEKELRRVELEVRSLLGEVIVVLQLVQALDEHQRVIGNLVVILHIDLTDVFVTVPVGAIDDQRVVVLVGEGETRDFVVQVENTDADGHGGGLVETVGGEHVECVVISVFPIERMEKIEFPVRRGETKERGDLRRRMSEGIRERRMIAVLRGHLTEISIRSVVLIDRELVRRLRKLDERKKCISPRLDEGLT